MTVTNHWVFLYSEERSLVSRSIFPYEKSKFCTVLDVPTVWVCNWIVGQSLKSSWLTVLIQFESHYSANATSQQCCTEHVPS